MVGYPTCLSDFDISIRWPTVSKKSKYSRSQSRLCTRNWLDCSCVSRWPNHVHSFCFWTWIHQWETSAVLKGLSPFTPAPSSLCGHPSPSLPSLLLCFLVLDSQAPFETLVCFAHCCRAIQSRLLLVIADI
jgi:hypothetical protein